MYYHTKQTYFYILRQVAYYMSNIIQGRHHILEGIYKDSSQNDMRVVLKGDDFCSPPANKAVKKQSQALKNTHNYIFGMPLILLSISTFLPLLEMGAQTELRTQKSFLAQNNAQNDDSLMLEEEGAASLQYLRDYWDRHFTAALNASYTTAFDGRSYRAYASARIGWKDKWKWISLNAEALLYHRNYLYELELSGDESKDLNNRIMAIKAECKAIGSNTDCTTSLSDTAKESRRMQLAIRLASLSQDDSRRQERTKFNLTVIDTNILPIEANVKLDIGDTLQILGGYHTVVWGQLDFLSPVDFLLPLRISSSGFSLIKAENRNPQLMALVSYFPYPWLELQGYFFPLLDLDPAIVDTVIRTTNERGEEDYRSVTKFETPKGTDAFRYAGRLLFYWDLFTIGFTYYYGFFQFGSDVRAKLNVDTTRTNEEGESIPIYSTQEDPSFQRFHAYGLETSYPIGKWIMKFETSYFSLNTTQELNVEKFNQQTLGYLLMDNNYASRERYIQWILMENNSNLGFAEHYIFFALGVDANLDDWLLNIGLALFVTERSSSADKGQDLYREAEDPPDENVFTRLDVLPAPIINIAYYTDDEKKDAIGIAGGFLNAGFGGVIYFSQEYFEALRLGVSLEYLFFFGDQLISSTEGYELTNPSYLSIRFLMEYKL